MQKSWSVKVMESIIHEQIEEYISGHDILYYILLGVGWVIADPICISWYFAVYIKNHWLL